jgi:hypothetical protein
MSTYQGSDDSECIPISTFRATYPANESDLALTTLSDDNSYLLGAMQRLLNGRFLVWVSQKARS